MSTWHTWASSPSFRPSCNSLNCQPVSDQAQFSQHESFNGIHSSALLFVCYSQKIRFHADGDAIPDRGAQLGRIRVILLFRILLYSQYSPVSSLTSLLSWEQNVNDLAFRCCSLFALQIWTLKTKARTHPHIKKRWRGDVSITLEISKRYKR